MTGVVNQLLLDIFEPTPDYNPTSSLAKLRERGGISCTLGVTQTFSIR